MATIQCGTVQFRDIQAILFDKDGTLADSRDYLWNLGQKRSRLIDAQIPGVQDPLQMAFGMDNNRLNPAGLLAVGTRAENEIAAAAYVAETGRDWTEAVRIVRSSFAEADRVLKRKADSTPPFAGAIAFLQALADSQIKIGIISADTTAAVQDFIDRYELGSLVQWAIGSSLELSKPDPALFHKACEQMGVSPAHTLAIGDSPADIEMAQNAGSAGCIAVTWGFTHSANLNQANSLAKAFADMQIIAS